MIKRKICVVAGTRAEYGLLYWLMKKIESDKELQLQLIVTGMHLSPEFGLTYQEIEKDFKIDKKIEMLLSSDTSVGISKSMGLAQISFSESYENLQPNLIVVLGDRYEIFSAVSAAMIARIPIAHLQALMWPAACRPRGRALPTWPPRMWTGMEMSTSSPLPCPD